MGREVGLEGEGSGGRGGGKWGERGREVGVGYPPVHPLNNAKYYIIHNRMKYETYTHNRGITNLVPRLYIFIMLNSTEHDISTAYKNLK